MKITTLPKYLDIIVKEANVPLMLWGPPGIGKTSAVEAWAEERGMGITVLIGSLLDPAEIGGMPMVQDSPNGPVTDYVLPKWFVEMAHTDTDHVLFLDELNTSPPAVMAAMLRLIQSRAIHDLELPGTVRIVAAGNNPEHMELAAPLPTAVCSRMAHIDVKAPSPADYADGEQHGWPVPAPFPATDGIARNQNRSQWADVIAKYWGVSPDHIEDFGHSGGDLAAQGRGYPCPRAWSNLKEVLACLIDDEDVETVHDLSRSLIGIAGRSFTHYSHMRDLPEPEKWLQNPDLAKPLATVDATQKMLNAVVETAIGTTKPRWDSAVRCMYLVARQSTAGLVHPAAKKLYRHMPEGSGGPYDRMPVRLRRLIEEAEGRGDEEGPERPKPLSVSPQSDSPQPRYIQKGGQYVEGASEHPSHDAQDASEHPSQAPPDEAGGDHRLSA